MPTGERAPALLALQQTHGNRYVQRVVAGIQAKLVVGQPGDVYEQEADRVADEVMRMPEPQVQRQVVPEEEEKKLLQGKPLAEQITPLVQRQVEIEEEEEIQTKQLLSHAPEIIPDVETRINGIRGGGPPLGPETRPSMDQRFGHDFSKIPLHPKTHSTIQPKLTISPQGDIYEQEADRVAYQVMRMPVPYLQHSCACSTGCPTCRTEQGGHGPLQTKLIQQNNAGEANWPLIVQKAISSSNQPLDSADRGFMETRFGQDFSSVRVYTDTRAGESAHALGARAYTVGMNVVFGAGQYAPGTTKGRRLLAHELTHVVQQRNHSVIQRAEIDDDPRHCANLVDIETDINTHVNGILQNHRGIPDGRQRVEAVYNELGRGSPYTAIEQWLEALPDNKHRRIPIAQTHYGHEEGLPGRRRGSGVINAWWRGEDILGVVVLVAGRCVGSDKFGHFFQQGRDYYHITQLYPSGHQGLPAEDYARAFGEWLEGAPPSRPELARWIEAMDARHWSGFDRLAYGQDFWRGVFGLSTTGVYSVADLIANEAGMHFYQALHRDPALVFNVRHYITGLWSETVNPSCYNSDMARIVAANDPGFQTERARIVAQANLDDPVSAPGPPERRAMRAARAMQLVYIALDRYARPLQCNF
jgi:hypothetical protein